MDHDEMYKAMRARATIELKEWAERKFERMSETAGAGWDPEDEKWLGDNEEIEMQDELFAKFGGKYPENIIQAIAGELNADGGWTRR